MNNRLSRWLVLGGSLVVSLGLSYGGARHAIAANWAASSNPDLWLRAANLEPSNPENWYRLGRYRQLDFDHEDLPLAISYYKRAVAIEPVASRYWADLAFAYESSGDAVQAEEAYRTAQKHYPISGDIAWRYGSFLLRQGRQEEGFRQIQHALSVDPKLTDLALSRCWATTQNVNLILSDALPPTPAAYWGAIRFMINVERPDGAMAAWKRLVAAKTTVSLTQAAPLMDFLIQHDDASDAQTVWRQALDAAGVARPAGNDKSLVWDGGFEQDLLNAGFAWHYEPLQGANLAFDESTVHSGRRSLRISFDGTANVYFHNLWQYVAVDANTTYQFSAYVRTEDLTTDEGVQFSIFGAAPAGVQPPVTATSVGTQQWTLQKIEFTTSPQTHLVQIALTRAPSKMLANKVRGTAWIDDVSLIPASLPQPTLR